MSASSVEASAVKRSMSACAAMRAAAGSGWGAPRPETNLLICHGLLAPRARWRERVVAYGRVAPEPTPSAASLAAGPNDPGVKPTPRAWTWAALMHRAFAIDVLACLNCGGRLRLIATLHDPVVIRKILAHLGMSGPSPGPAPPELSAVAP